MVLYTTPVLYRYFFPKTIKVLILYGTLVSKKLKIGMAVLVGIVTSRDIDFIVEKKDEGASIALRYLKGTAARDFQIYILVILGRGINEKPLNAQVSKVGFILSFIIEVPATGTC
jgi:hypothetical protein